MGSRFPEAVPGRHIPLLVLCRCVSPSVRSLSVMAYFSGVIAARTVIQLSFSPPFCFWILGYVWERKSRYKKPPTDFFRSRLCICQMKYVYYIDIKYSVRTWTHYNPNIRSCQALPKKVFEGGDGQRWYKCRGKTPARSRP